MNVLYISYDGLTDPLGQSQILPYIIPLSQKGVHYKIISFEKKVNFKKNKNVINELIEGKNITWIPLPYHKFPPVISTVFDIMQGHKAIKSIIKTIDFIHARSYISALLAEKAFQKWGTPYIFDMRGFWIDERIEGNIWNPKSLIFKKVILYFRKKEIAFLTNASSIVSLTHKGKEIIHDKWSIDQDKIEVIPCATDQNHFAINNEIKKNKAKTLLYVGSTGTWYLTKEMLIFYKNLLKKIPDLNFHIYTGTPKEDILNLAKENNVPIENINIEFSSRNELPEKIQECHFGICFIKPVFSKSASSPVKMGEYIAMNIPVICNANVGDNDHIMNQYQVGISISNIKDITDDQINFLASIPEENFTYAVNDYFSVDKAINQYWKIYNNIVNR